MIQIGMHAGSVGGADRYFDGLCRAFGTIGEPFNGFVFEGQAGVVDLPRGVQVLGSADASVMQRTVLLRNAVSRGLNSQSSGCKINGKRSLDKQIVANHFALYSWPIIHPLARWRRDVVVVSHFHGPWADESLIEGASQLAVAGKRMLEKWVYRSSDRVIAASEAFRRIAIDTYGVRPDRVVAVPLAIDAHPFFVASKLPRDLARTKIGWPLNRRIVLCLRRLTQRMGLDRLVEAWSAVVTAHPDAMLVIGGTGPLRDLLERQVRTAGLEQHVMFAGFVPEKDLPFAYRAADFSVVPSVAMEGFGLVILESLAAGTPALLTPVGGMPEIMRPLEPGLVLQGSEICHLERGLVDLLAGSLPVPSESDCVEYVQRNYNWELAARRVLDEYQVACASATKDQSMNTKQFL